LLKTQHYQRGPKYLVLVVTKYWQTINMRSALTNNSILATTSSRVKSRSFASRKQQQQRREKFYDDDEKMNWPGTKVTQLA
jgi:hypothetical protein